MLVHALYLGYVSFVNIVLVFGVDWKPVLFGFNMLFCEAVKMLMHLSLPKDDFVELRHFFDV